MKYPEVVIRKDKGDVVEVREGDLVELCGPDGNTSISIISAGSRMAVCISNTTGTVFDGHAIQLSRDFDWQFVRIEGCGDNLYALPTRKGKE